MADWAPQLSRLGKPRYLAIADAIAEDIRNGKLAPSERLPPQRKLARRLDIDFTTVARGYVEAQRRGLIESRVGQGTYVRASAKRRHGPIARHPEIVDLSMNLPPEPDDPELLDRMQDGLEAIGRDLVYLMRYQGFGGVPADKDAASHWLRHRALVPQQDRLFIAPGAHPALLGILSVLAKAGDVLLSETLTYPGARSIAAQLGLRHIGLPMDDDGVDADAFADACKRHAPRALYLNPTLLNPTTHTIAQKRRSEIIAVARRYGVAIIEDDPYGFLPVDGPLPFAALAPEITWHVAGLAKCLGAGLRIAYVVAPEVRSGWLFASSVRTATVMASPVTIALATRWITDGTADALLAAVRQESIERQGLVDGDPAAGDLPRRPGRLPSLAFAAGAVDALGFRRAYPLDRRQRCCQRCVRDRRDAARGGARLPRWPRGPVGGAQCARVYGARARGIADADIDISLISNLIRELQSQRCWHKQGGRPGAVS